MEYSPLDSMLQEFVDILEAYYQGCLSKFRVDGKKSSLFDVEWGDKQDYILSPVLSNYCIDLILERAHWRFKGSW